MGKRGAQLKAQPYRIGDGGALIACEPSEATHVWLHMPGPISNRLIPVILKGKRAGTGCWSWNGDTERPTLKPSIRSRDGHHTCHTWVNDGKAQFLADCTHDLAGQTLDLLDVE